MDNSNFKTPTPPPFIPKGQAPIKPEPKPITNAPKLQQPSDIQNGENTVSDAPIVEGATPTPGISSGTPISKKHKKRKSKKIIIGIACVFVVFIGILAMLSQGTFWLCHDCHKTVFFDHIKHIDSGKYYCFDCLLNKWTSNYKSRNNNYDNDYYDNNYNYGNDYYEYQKDKIDDVQEKSEEVRDLIDQYNKSKY